MVIDRITIRDSSAPVIGDSRSDSDRGSGCVDGGSGCVVGGP